MTKREKVFNALVNCTSLHTSTTCLNCPYAIRPNEVIHYGDVRCTGALLRDALIALTNDKNSVIDDLVSRLKEKADYYYAYVLVEDIEKIAEDMKNDR